jgi:hypothetical protein
MNEELNRRWRGGLPPFDGVTVSGDGRINATFYPLEVLRQVLAAIIDHLSEQYPVSQVFRLSDWHEHDGFVAPAKHSTWDELRSQTASIDALLSASEKETYVRTGVFSEDYSYYLRFYIPDEHDNPYADSDPRSRLRWGTFDVTCHDPLASELSEVALNAGAETLQRSRAKDFFDKSYSG